MFDVSNFAKKLEANGFSSEQATILVELQRQTIADSIDTQLATKDDINRLDKEIVIVKWVSFATFAIVAVPFIKALFE